MTVIQATTRPRTANGQQEDIKFIIPIDKDSVATTTARPYDADGHPRDPDFVVFIDETGVPLNFKAVGGVAFLSSYIAEADAGDRGLAFNRAFAAGVKSLFVDDASSGAINTTVLMPQGVAVSSLSGNGLSLGAQFTTAAAIDMFRTSGSNVTMKGLTLTHTGAAGRVVYNAPTHDSFTLDNNQIAGIHAANADPLVQISASLSTRKFNRFTNLRPNAWAVDYYRQLGGPIIVTNGLIDVWGGTGKGWIIRGEVGADRPEGFVFEGDQFINTNTLFQIEQCLMITNTACIFDQGGARVGILKPTGQGITSAKFIGGYITGVNAGGGGAALYHDTSAQGGATSRGDLLVDGMTIAFGANIGLECFDWESVTFVNNNISAMLTPIKSRGAKQLTFSGNTNQEGFVTTNFDIADGAGGGKHIIGPNHLSSTGAIALAMTDRSKFYLDPGNSGVKLAGTSSMLSANPPVTGDYVAVPHGLAGTPDLARIQASAFSISGGYQNVVAQITSADATNVVVQIFFTPIVPGRIRVNVTASL